MERLTKIRLIMGIIVLITTLIAYRDAFLDFEYFKQIINKFTLIGNLVIAIGLILISFEKLKSKYFIHLVLVSWLIFIVVINFFQGGLFSEEWYGAILHYFVPIIMFLDFLFLYKDYIPNYRDVYKVTIIPFIYLIYILIYGLITGIYPYSFIDLTMISVYEFLVTAFILLIAYCFSGFIFISIYKFINKIPNK